MITSKSLKRWEKLQEKEWNPLAGKIMEGILLKPIGEF